MHGEKTLYMINNPSIHQASTGKSSSKHAAAKTHTTPPAELMNCGVPDQPDPLCWDCRFFETVTPMDRGQPPEHECQEGQCRRHPPVTDHGQRDSEVNYAVFPIVFADDWCGEFVPRTHRKGCKDRTSAAQESKSDPDPGFLH